MGKSLNRNLKNLKMKPFVFIACVLILISCDSSRVYEDYNDLEESFWHLDSAQRFTFQIDDAKS